jgi:integrase
VRALRDWLAAAGIAEGLVFRSFSMPRRRGEASRLQPRGIAPKDVARLVQRVARRARLEVDFGRHSLLRAGFVTSAAQRKVPEVDIQRVTGHKSVAVLRGYVRRATLFEDPPLTTIIGT